MTSAVLLVDDEHEFVHTLDERLRSRGFETRVAYSGEEALSSLRQSEPESVVLDLQMPGIGGIEALRRIRRDHPTVRVIILTGHGSERDRKKATDLGAHAWFWKPADIDALTASLTSTVNEPTRPGRGQRGGTAGRTSSGKGARS